VLVKAGTSRGRLDARLAQQRQTQTPFSLAKTGKNSSDRVGDPPVSEEFEKSGRIQQVRRNHNKIGRIRPGSGSHIVGRGPASQLQQVL